MLARDHRKPKLADALLRPRSVAIVGASDDVSKTAARPLQYLRQAGYGGQVYPVNRTRDQVLGERCWRSLGDLPECPDHAFLLVPTGAVADAVEECGRLGIPCVTVLAAGFSEAGEAGTARQYQVLDIARRYGVRLLGPSSLGLVNLHENLVLTGNAAFAEADLPRGSLFVASQSGSLIGAIVSRGKQRGFGFSGLVSVGNEADLGIAEICAATLDDPHVGSYLLFLETIRDGAALRRFARDALAAGRPVVAYKLGRSQAAQELAQSHTGALAAEDDVVSAFLADCGIARVDTFEALLESPELMRRLPLSRGAGGKRVGVVTTTGGGAAMVVDQLAVRGVDVVGPSAETLERMRVRGAEAAPGPVVDLTLAGTRYDVMRAALEEMLAGSEFDLVVAVIGSSARFKPELAVQPVIDVAAQDGRLAVFIVPEAPHALQMLAEHRIPCFRTPESCADAVAAAMARRVPSTDIPTSIKTTAVRTLDEQDSYALLDRVGVAHAPAVTVTDDLAPALSLPAPWVAKVQSSDIIHKSDIGGVIVGISDRDALASAVTRIRQSVATRKPGVNAGRVLVQSMVRGVGEALIGYRVHPQLGPIVLVAAGGVATEIYADRAIRMAPVDLDTARDMILEVRGFRLMEGFRGKPAGDIEALAQAIVGISRFGSISEPAVVEFEVNPVIVGRQGEGVAAVDAVARVATSSSS